MRDHAGLRSASLIKIHETLKQSVCCSTENNTDDFTRMMPPRSRDMFSHHNGFWDATEKDTHFQSVRLTSWSNSYTYKTSQILVTC